jgi:hypothetical protein
VATAFSREADMHRSRILLSTAAMAITLVVASVGTVAAAEPITIPPAATFGTEPTVTVSPDVKLVGGVLATIHVDVVCDPMPSSSDPSIDPTKGHSEGTRAQVIQAVSKKAIASGETNAFGGSFVCDGSTVNPMDISVISQSVPFRKGTAVIGVQVQICNDDCSGSGYTSSGPIVTALRSK